MFQGGKKIFPKMRNLIKRFETFWIKGNFKSATNRIMFIDGIALNS